MPGPKNAKYVVVVDGNVDTAQEFEDRQEAEEVYMELANDAGAYTDKVELVMTRVLYASRKGVIVQTPRKPRGSGGK